ncbi:TonB-dependent siderophore receptor [Paraglaciecola sp.]|uniref:TonB-dependent siderophore receptor n=1 Tax=Paraglaciecola sp. TaxID=1920173 RepID=UPI0030F44FC1
MRPLFNKITLCVLATFSINHALAVQVDNHTDKDESSIERIRIYGEQGISNSATRLGLSMADTPQTVTVVSRPQIEDFSLTNINDVLAFTPGVTVESVETDRTYYTARGFDVVNFQFDSVGVPFSSGLADGHQDSALFEQVEVVKGAAGLITGLANPSATVNYIRKRPTQETSGSLALTLGENSRGRLEGDLSGQLTDSIRGRFVAVKDKGDSYLDRYSDDNNVFYGIVEADLSDSTLLTFGHSYNTNNVKGSMSGALPLFYTDGSMTNYDVSTSTATDWAFRDTDRSSSFIELKQKISQDWTLNTQYTRNKISTKSDLFYTYGTPDKDTEVGLLGYAYAYNLDEKQDIADIFITGSFSALGRQHELIVGYNYAQIDLFGLSRYNYTTGYPVLDSHWADGKSAGMDFPDYDNFTTGHQDKQKHNSVYIATRINVLDNLSILVGARHMKITQDGYNYGVLNNSETEETVPYAGAVYTISDNLSAYGSYSEVFTPQNFIGRDFKSIGVAQGSNTELGFKYSFDDKLSTMSVAMFRSKLDNLAEFGEVIDTINIYDGVTYDTEGYEVALIGALTNNLNISAGATYLFHIADDTGSAIRTYIPLKTLKLATSYYFDSVPKLSVGASYRWQDDIYNASEAVRVDQGAYATIDAFARYQLNSNIDLAINVSNLADKKHLTSLYWTQSYYAAPRQLQATIAWRY